jgi:hypothetical protein
MAKWLMALVAGSALLSGAPAVAGSRSREVDGAQVVKTAGKYMVEYKKPRWRKWKCCGPYSYEKACRVAEKLEAKGCQTKVKPAK